MAKKQNGGSGRDQYAPKPGSYKAGPAEPAQHRTQGVSETYGGTLSSRQGASKYPREALHSDNARAAELIKSDPKASPFRK